jgi:hypothetical protein|tara:strand:+ start:14533 stop:14805 length:273 start_codon:yes stop_codon:yes gene_type:complete
LDAGNGDEFVFLKSAGDDVEISVKRAGLDVSLFDRVIRFHDPCETLVLVEAEGGVFHEQSLHWLSHGHPHPCEEARGEKLIFIFHQGSDL